MRTAIEIAEAVRNRQLKATEVLEECLGAIDRANGDLNAFSHVDADLARDRAAAIDAGVARGDDPGPFAGVPIAVKDLEDCAGMPTGHGSRWFADAATAEADSVHVARLRAAGAVPVGKTTLPEFGAVAFTASAATGVTRNPWNPDTTPGGSSGGSAAAVAAAMVPMATATDGGGSTRIPASFTGLFGMKPSYGRIPRPFDAASQTTVHGVLTTTVADSARHLDVTAGPDDRDRTSLPLPRISYQRVIEELDLAGVRIGWSPDLGFAEVDEQVAGVCRDAAEALAAAAGTALMEVKVSIPDPTRTWLSAGAADLWEHVEAGLWPDRADELMGSVRRSFEATEQMTIPRWARIVKRRHQLDAEVARIFEEVDVLLTPTTAVPAFPASGPPPSEINGRDVPPTMAVPFTMLANLCWNPAASVPAGTTPAGLPAGLQIMGCRHRDDVVLRLARIFEQCHPWPRFAPGYPR